MTTVLGRRDHIGRIAAELAPSRRYWAIVGNGPNRIAAQELRIKLSELCYKSIACDVTEDKKHIDLSAEPLILVCAAGLTGSTADDVAKEVAIYRAHKAAPIVIATEGEGRFGAALHLIEVPPTHPQLAFVLSAMAGHLFGYEAALAIDGQAQVAARGPGRHRGQLVSDGVTVGEVAPAPACARTCAPRPTPFFDGLRAGEYDGHLEASTASRLASLLRYALGTGAARRLPDRARQGRHARPSSSTTSRRPSPAPSRSSPGPSTPSSTRPRRSPSASAAPTRRCCRCRSSQPGARRRSAPRLPQLPHAQGAGRPRPGRRRGGRLHPLPRRGRPDRRRRRHPRASSTVAGWRSASRAAASATPSLVGHQAPASPSSGSCWWPAAAATAAPS